MKALVLILICAGMTACTQPDPRDVRLLALEQRVAKLEADAKTAAQEDVHRRESLELCLKNANDWYNQHLRLNATTSTKTSFSVPLPAMQEAITAKHEKIEQCKLLYGAR